MVLSYASWSTEGSYPSLFTCPAHIQVTFTIANEITNNNNFNETLTTIKTYAVPFIEIMQQAAKMNDKFV